MFNTTNSSFLPPPFSPCHRLRPQLKSTLRGDLQAFSEALDTEATKMHVTDLGFVHEQIKLVVKELLDSISEDTLSTFLFRNVSETLGKLMSVSVCVCACVRVCVCACVRVCVCACACVEVNELMALHPTSPAGCVPQDCCSHPSMRGKSNSVKVSSATAPTTPTTAVSFQSPLPTTATFDMLSILELCVAPLSAFPPSSFPNVPAQLTGRKRARSERGAWRLRVPHAKRTVTPCWSGRLIRTTHPQSQRRRKTNGSWLLWRPWGIHLLENASKNLTDTDKCGQVHTDTHRHTHARKCCTCG